MKTVIVAVDGSAPSLAAVPTAAGLVKAEAGTLLLVYVSPPVLLPPTSYPEAVERLEAGEKAFAAEALGKAAAAALALGVRCDQVHLHGPPAELIADLAESQKVDAVVVGARGHNALARVLLGSVADRLVHICKRPVLVVR